jgi:hypothetical protein
MKMAGHQRPLKARRFRLFQDEPQVLQKTVTVPVILEYPATLDASRNDVVPCFRCVDA